MGQTQEYDIYPQSRGLRGLNPCIPLRTTPSGRSPSLLLHRDRGTTTESPLVYQGEAQQQEAGVGDADWREKTISNCEVNSG